MLRSTPKSVKACDQTFTAPETSENSMPMYTIEINDDESITIDYSSKRIACAREIRPAVWDELLENWQASGGVLDFDARPVGELFCDLRIDGARALRMLDARGDTTAAPIDPAPDFAESGESQIMGDELVNDERTFEALEARFGVTSVDFGNPDSVDMFVSMRETLESERAILPGMKGILRATPNE